MLDKFTIIPPRLVPMILCSLTVLSGWLSVAGQYRFDSWTTDNGLPQNGVRTITQTPDGYLWLTTFDGLVRFDGVKFTVFNKSNSPGIINNRFLSVRAFRDGSVWAATEGGELTVYRDGKFTSFTADQVPGKMIFGFETDETGEVLINIDSKLYYLRDGQIVFAKNTEDDGTIKNFVTDKTGGRWDLSLDGATYSKEGQQKHYDVRLKYLNYYNASAYADSNGGLWISDTDKVVYLRDGKTTEYSAGDGVPQNVIGHNFWEETDGSI